LDESIRKLEADRTPEKLYIARMLREQKKGRKIKDITSLLFLG
jgi:hypothetical protein